MKIPGAIKRIGIAAVGLLALEIGARIAIPGLDSNTLANYLATVGGNVLISLYNFIGGGGLARGAILGIGIMPNVSAHILMRLLAVVSPAVRAMHTDDDARRVRWTRALTVGLAAIQSFGFARFVQNVPGVVANPGTGFMLQTVLVLTGGAVVTMLIGERLFAHDTTGDDIDDDAVATPAVIPRSDAHALPAGAATPVRARPMKESQPLNQRRDRE